MLLSAKSKFLGQDDENLPAVECFLTTGNQTCSFIFILFGKVSFLMVTKQSFFTQCTSEEEAYFKKI